MSWIGLAYARLRGNKPVRISDYKTEEHMNGNFHSYTVSFILRFPDGREVTEGHTYFGRPFPKNDMKVAFQDLNRRICDKYCEEYDDIVL